MLCHDHDILDSNFILIFLSRLQFIKQCEDEELMDVVLPRLVKAITLWEFLMMKSEKGRPLKPCIPDIVREFETLHKEVQKVCQEYLKPCNSGSEEPSSAEEIPNKLEVSANTSWSQSPVIVYLTPGCLMSS
jgi:hypothetical protein